MRYNAKDVVDTADAEQLIPAVDSLLSQMATAFHKITSPRPKRKHVGNTKRLRSLVRDTPPPSSPSFSAHIAKIRDTVESLRASNDSDAIRKLHRSLVGGCKMKTVVTESLCPKEMPPTVICHPATRQLEQDPVRVAKIFGSTLQHLGGDPSYQPPPGFVDEVLTYSPSCPAPAALEAIAYVSWTAFAARLKHSKPSKSGCGDCTNNYLMHLAPEPIEKSFPWNLNRFSSSPMPHHWLGSHICLLYKRGNPYQAANYRPVSLLNRVYKLVATFTCGHLQQQTPMHSQPSPIVHRELPRHQCADHIYHLKSSYARSKSGYSLYIDFNKPFNSVPLSTLWTVLEHSNLSRAAITSVQNLYASPVDAPIINGHCPHSYVQASGLRQGCPLSPLLFILYLNALFSYSLATTPPTKQGRVTSHHAFIDGILMCSEDPSHIQ